MEYALHTFIPSLVFLSLQTHFYLTFATTIHTHDAEMIKKKKRVPRPLKKSEKGKMNALLCKVAFSVFSLFIIIWFIRFLAHMCLFPLGDRQSFLWSRTTIHCCIWAHCVIVGVGVVVIVIVAVIIIRGIMFRHKLDLNTAIPTASPHIPSYIFISLSSNDIHFFLQSQETRTIKLRFPNGKNPTDRVCVVIRDFLYKCQIYGIPRHNRFIPRR